MFPIWIGGLRVQGGKVAFILVGAGKNAIVWCWKVPLSGAGKCPCLVLETACVWKVPFNVCWFVGAVTCNFLLLYGAGTGECHLLAPVPSAGGCKWGK